MGERFKPTPREEIKKNSSVKAEHNSKIFDANAGKNVTSTSQDSLVSNVPPATIHNSSLDSEISSIQPEEKASTNNQVSISTSQESIAEQVEEKPELPAGNISDSLRHTRTKPANFESRVSELRKQGLSRKEIRERLGISKAHLSNTIRELLQKGETSGIQGATSTKFKTLLQEHMEMHPGKGIELSKFAQQLEISRERARQLYRIISEKMPVPPLKSEMNRQLREEKLNLDEKVNSLRKQGLHEVEIVKELGISEKNVGKSLARLRKKLISEIKVLRNQGLGYLEISERLGETRGIVNHAIQQLIDSGEIQRTRKKRRTNAEAEFFQEKVKQLRLKGLTANQIAEELKIAKTNVADALLVLLKNGRIPRTRKRRSKEEIDTLKLKVKDLRNKGMTQRQISETLEVSYATVGQIIFNLIKGGEITKKNQEQKYIELRKQIKELKIQGMTTKQIAGHLNVSRPTVSYVIHCFIQTGEILPKKVRKKS